MLAAPTLDQRIAELEAMAAEWGAKEGKAWGDGDEELEGIAHHWRRNVHRVLERLYEQRKRECGNQPGS